MGEDFAAARPQYEAGYKGKSRLHCVESSLVVAQTLAVRSAGMPVDPRRDGGPFAFRGEEA